MTTTSSPVLIERLLANAGWAEGLARSLTGDDPADVSQEAMSIALRHPPDPGRPLRPWLGEVVRNVVRGRFRHRQRERARETATFALSDERRAGAEEILSRLQIQRLLAELVAELPEPLRQTVLLRYFEGLTAAEISRRLGEPAGTVRWRLKQGLDRLRVALDARHGGARQDWVRLLVPPPVNAGGRAPSKPPSRPPLEGRARLPALLRPARLALLGAMGVGATLAIMHVPWRGGEPGTAARPGATAHESATVVGGSIAGTDRPAAPTPPSGSGASPGLPRFVAALSAGDLPACQRELAARRATITPQEQFKRTPEIFAAAPPNAAAQKALAPVVETILTGPDQASQPHFVECRGSICKIDGLFERGDQRRTRLILIHSDQRLTPLLQASPPFPPFNAALRAPPDEHGRKRDRRIIYLRIAAPAPGQPAKLDDCQRQLEALEGPPPAAGKRL